MAHILFVSYFFTPDGLSTAVLMSELAQDLQTLGHQVSVITTTPHYNVEAQSLARQPLRPRWGRWLQESDLNGMAVFHVQVAPKGSRIWLRALDYLRYHLLGLLVGLFLVKRADVVFAPSPPLTIGVHAWLLALWHRAPFIYNVQEIYPDVAVRLGVLRNRGLIWLLERLEHFIYARASRVTVISEWFRRTLAGKGVAQAKLVLIPNFVDTDFIQPRPRHNGFSRRHSLDEKFVVLYAGNIGLTQGFDAILVAAERLAAAPEIHFLINGGGAQFNWLDEQIRIRRLSNVTLLPYQPRDVVPDIYATADLCLVPMKRGMAQDTFPSKIYTIMAAGRAALVSADAGSELEWVVGQARCGWSVAPDDPSSLADAIQKIHAQAAAAREQGVRGRAYVVEHHSRHAIAAKYDALIRGLMQK